MVSLSGAQPSRGTTTMSGRSSHLGWKTPMTAACFTSGWPTAAFSRSMELIHSPPDLITSLVRSVMRMKPCSSRVATSPVGNQPSVVEPVARPRP